MRPELDWLHSKTLVSKSCLLLNGRRKMKWWGVVGLEGRDRKTSVTSLCPEAQPSLVSGTRR